MPELPEVETIRSCLACHQGASIMKVEVKRPDIIRRADFEVAELNGLSIKEVKRRGKYLDLVLSSRGHLILHMGMSGRFYQVEEPGQIEAAHVHLVIYLSNEAVLVYQDARRFGGVWLIKDAHDFFIHLGVEPLSRAFNTDYMVNVLKGRKTAIKTLLLDQRLISGIGNIYADEALFMAGLLPDRPSNSLSRKETEALVKTIKKVLRQGIEQRGTTFRDFRDGYNQMGGFQDHLKVYGRFREPCPTCGRPLERVRLGGRSTHYCGHCQH
ncbi:MAG: bifunctional DNA-formamidopyrimidine glycosylase/DNA-(apurinic or apyrimidinic site) lyase [Syntrophomonas sp.]